MNKRIILIGTLLLIICCTMTVSATAPFTEAPDAFKFKQIIWDDGWIWVLMLAMGLATIFDFIRIVIANSKGQKAMREDEEMWGKAGKKQKPSYEILIRRRIE